MLRKEEMEKALKVLFQPGDVFEVRVLGGISPGYRREHTESGYFDYGHIEDIYSQLAHLTSYHGVYVTINPCEPDLLCRSVNRIQTAKKNTTTSDKDILCRRWLLIDCDAVRKSGIASSDDEHNFALRKAKEIYYFLKKNKWEEPVIIDSGNGGQLLYRIAEASEDNCLLQKILNYLDSKFSDEKVNVDISVFNPARICRLPGTKNCKGDHTQNRPHRFDEIISVPAEIKVTATEVLSSLLPEDKTAVITSGKNDRFNIDDWIDNHIPELSGKAESWRDGRKWVFDVCPFNPDHNNQSACIIENNSGAVGFTCHHNGCADKDWKSLRSLYDPDYQSDLPEISNEQLESIRKSLLQKQEVIEEGESDELTLDELNDLMQEQEIWRTITAEDVKKSISGTLIGEMVNIYSSVTVPPLPLEAALIKSIVTAGCCLSGEASMDLLNKRYGGGNISGAMCRGIMRGRVVINTGGGQGCNVYALLAGNSASGKDIGNLLDHFAGFPNPSAKVGTDSVGDYMLGTGGSAEGLADVLAEKPNGLLLISEMRDWLDAKHWRSKATSFLTQAFNKAMFEESFSGRSGKNAKRKADYCSPNILASVQPEVFERLATLENIESGFFGRFLCAVMPTFYGLPARFDLWAKLKELKNITDIFCRKEGIVEIPHDYSYAMQSEFIGKTQGKMNATWRRLINEYYPRLAVMLSVTTDFRTHDTKIELNQEAWDKARILVLFFFANAVKLFTGIDGLSPQAKEKITDREIMRQIVFEKVYKIYKKIGTAVSFRQIQLYRIRCNGSRISSALCKEILKELCDYGYLSEKQDKYIPLVEEY